MIRKVKKIGRNAPCPCGSGRKYKKCCLSKGIDYREQQAQIVQKPKKHPILSKYNTIDVLKSLAALSIQPENYGKYVRLEEASIEAILNRSSSKGIISGQGLKNWLDRSYPSHHLEDPLNGFFVDLVPFIGGNYLIFPGITENAAYVTSTLLSAILSEKGSNLPQGFKKQSRDVAIAILSISTIIAHRLGYSRYQDGQEKETPIFIPEEEWLNVGKDSVSFTIEELNSILTQINIDPGILDPFTIDLQMDGIASIKNTGNILEQKPIILTEQEYIIAAPTNLSLALVSHLWQESQKEGCLGELNDAYHEVVWHQVQSNLLRLGFKDFASEEEIPFSPQTSIKERIFRFDEDKLAYVNLSYQGTTSTQEDFQTHRRNIVNFLSESTNLSKYEVLEISIFAPTGGEYLFTVDKINGTQNLSLDSYELLAISYADKYNAIDFWKFANAINTQLANIQIIPYSFIGLWELYIHHGKSFYLNDDYKPTIISLDISAGRDFYHETFTNNDLHFARIRNKNEIGSNLVFKKDSFQNLYIAPSDLGNIFRLFLKAYGFPIWISPRVDINQVPTESRSVYFEVADAIGYWLEELYPFIIPYLESVPSEPINLIFSLEPKEAFEQFDFDNTKDPSFREKFETSVTSEEISLVIPKEILPYLKSADNEGDRALVYSLLNGLNQLLEAHKLSKIPGAEFPRIIEKCAPKGLKKKFFLLDTANNLFLDPRFKSAPRFVDDYDIGVINDSLISDLGNRCPPEGILDQKDKKTKLGRDIVLRVLLPQLKEKLELLNSTNLLPKLIGINEGLLHHREELRLSTPTRIACFVSPEQQKEDLSRSLEKLDRTTLAIRCLIEHLSAEPSDGHEVISNTKIDELIAIMDQIILWGSLGDQIEYELLDCEISILPTKRIGIVKEPLTNVFDPYRKSKIEERIASAIEAYEQVFDNAPTRETTGILPSIDTAFISDFGISFTRIRLLLLVSARISIDLSDYYSHLPKSKFFNELNSRIESPFESDEFEKAIDFLSLFNRGNVKNIPDGYNSFDISPWRYNRGLSLLRKPLILVDNDSDSEDPWIYWGMRQNLQSLWYLEKQLYTGRFKTNDESRTVQIIGKLRNKTGEKLVEELTDILNEEGLILDPEVKIGPNGKFIQEEDIGDIDILIIDPNNKTLYSIECKNMAPSRNIKEMVEELSKLFGSSSEKGWIQKHQERHVWIQNNLTIVGEEYEIDLIGFSIQSYFVTGEDMLTPHLIENGSPIPFVRLLDVKEKGLGAFIPPENMETNEE